MTICTKTIKGRTYIQLYLERLVFPIYQFGTLVQHLHAKCLFECDKLQMHIQNENDEIVAAKTNILSRCQAGYKLLKPDLGFDTNFLQCKLN